MLRDKENAEQTGISTKKVIEIMLYQAVGIVPQKEDFVLLKPPGVLIRELKRFLHDFDETPRSDT